MKMFKKKDVIRTSDSGREPFRKKKFASGMELKWNPIQSLLWKIVKMKQTATKKTFNANGFVYDRQKSTAH